MAAAVQRPSQSWLSTVLPFLNFTWFSDAAALLCSGPEKDTPLCSEHEEIQEATTSNYARSNESCSMSFDRNFTRRKRRQVPSAGDGSFDDEEMWTVFKKFDENQDGLVCATDLLRFMARLGFKMSEEEAAAMVETIDENGDGCIDFDEFCSLCRSTLSDGESQSNQDRVHSNDCDNYDTDLLLEAFRVFDKNDDGFISVHELQTVLLDLGMPQGKTLRECERMIQGVDVDGNGEIDIAEFKQMMSRNSLQI